MTDAPCQLGGQWSVPDHVISLRAVNEAHNNTDRQTDNDTHTHSCLT